MRKHLQYGLSLVELMIALTIGLILMTGLTLVITGSMGVRTEMEKTNREIESGRYGVEVLAEDIRHAGLFSIYRPALSTAALPDPCSTAVTDITAALPWLIQGYHAYDPASGTLTCLPSGMVLAGSDVLVIRRMNTVAATTFDANTIYIQPGFTGGNPNQTSVLVNTGSNVASLSLKKKDAGTGGSTQDTYTTTADIFPMLVRIYFISPCSYGTGTNGACTASDDTIPTLKRIDLGSGPAFGAPVAIAEGVENLHIEYGIDTDNDGTAVGNFRQCVDATECSATDWQNAVAANVYLLVRNPEQTGGYQDTKTYQMGAISYTPSGTSTTYKRHVFSSFVRARNLSMGRECTPTTTVSCP